MKKVIVSVLVVLLIMVVGLGGWYLFDSIQKEKNKNAELENRLIELKTISNVENKKINANEEIKKVLKDDNWISNNIRKVNYSKGESVINFIKLSDIDGMPAYLIAWDYSDLDKNERGRLVYVVSYNGEKIVLSNKALNPFIDGMGILEVNTVKNYIVTTGDAEGDSSVYSIDKTEFNKIASATYNPLSNNKNDSMEYFNGKGDKIDGTKYSEYLVDLEEVKMELTNNNIDKYVK